MATEPNNENERATARPEAEHANSIELLDLEPARTLWRKWLGLLEQWKGFAAGHDRDADELERLGRRGASAARARAEWCRGRAARARVYLARFQARIDVLTGLPS
jgi:hypothetical protein